MRRWLARKVLYVGEVAVGGMLQVCGLANAGSREEGADCGVTRPGCFSKNDPANLKASLHLPTTLASVVCIVTPVALPVGCRGLVRLENQCPTCMHENEPVFDCSVSRDE